MAGRAGRQHREAWWTRARVVEGAVRFFTDFGVAVTSEREWRKRQQFTATRWRGGRPSNRGEEALYPSRYAIFKYFATYRQMWKEVAKARPDLGIEVDSRDEDWTPLEEWWITETVGVIPRAEVSRLMFESGCGRTEAAIKGHLYDMGINAYNRWGWTVSRMQRVMGVSQSTIMWYVEHGHLPFFQTHKYIYVEPADFLVISEYDWSRPDIPAELERAVRASLVERVCYALLRFDRRRYSYHRAQPLRDFFTGRIKTPRKRSMPMGPAPESPRVGDFVRITDDSYYRRVKGRIGQVKSVQWSPQSRAATPENPGRGPCWMAVVEFKKLRPRGKPEQPRVRYSVPVAILELAERPVEPACQRKGPHELKRRGRDAARDDRRKKELEERGRSALSTRLNVPARFRGSAIR